MDPVRLLPAPPAAESPETRAELDLLLALQAKRTPEQVHRCKAEKELTVAAFQGVWGAAFSPRSCRRWTAANKGGPRRTPDQQGGENTFCSPTALALESKLQPCLAAAKKSPVLSQPTSDLAMVFALVWRSWFPKSGPRSLERAREIGWNREVAGRALPQRHCGREGFGPGHRAAAAGRLVVSAGVGQGQSRDRQGPRRGPLNGGRTLDLKKNREKFDSNDDADDAYCFIAIDKSRRLGILPIPWCAGQNRIKHDGGASSAHVLSVQFQQRTEITIVGSVEGFEVVVPDRALLLRHVFGPNDERCLVTPKPDIG